MTLDGNVTGSLQTGFYPQGLSYHNVDTEARAKVLIETCLKGRALGSHTGSGKRWCRGASHRHGAQSTLQALNYSGLARSWGWTEKKNSGEGTSLFPQW